MALNKKTMDLLKKGMFDSETAYEDASYVVYSMVWHKMTKDQIVSQIMLRSNLTKEVIERLVDQKTYSLNKKNVCKASKQEALTLDEYQQRIPFQAKSYLISGFAESEKIERDVRYVAFCCASKNIPKDITKTIIVESFDFDRTKISLWTDYAYEDFSKKESIKECSWRQKFAQK